MTASLRKPFSLQTAKSWLLPRASTQVRKRQGVRSVESVGQGERSSRSGCTNSEAGNVHCETNKVRNVDGVFDLYMTKVSSTEVVVIVTTELESSRNSSTTSEWDLVGPEVRSTRCAVNTEAQGVAIVEEDKFWCDDRSSVVLNTRKILSAQLSVEEVPVVAGLVGGVKSDVSR